MYYVIVAICALVMLFIMFEISFYNKFQLLLIKIHESLNNIDILFEKKYNLWYTGYYEFLYSLQLKGGIENV